MGGGLRPPAPAWGLASETEILAWAIVALPVVWQVGEPVWALWAVGLARRAAAAHEAARAWAVRDARAVRDAQVVRAGQVALAVAPAIDLDPSKSVDCGNGLPNTHPR